MLRRPPLAPSALRLAGWSVVAMLCGGPPNAADLPEMKPGALVDYAPLAFQPETWKAKGQCAMLRLWRKNGRNDWLRRFFRALGGCPVAPENTRDGALQQCWNWYLAASLAARRDLSAAFVDDWRLPLTATTRKVLAGVDWNQPDLTPEGIDRQVSAASTTRFSNH